MFAETASSKVPIFHFNSLLQPNSVQYSQSNGTNVSKISCIIHFKMSCGGRAGGITAAKACGGDFCCAPKPCAITSCGAAQCCPSQRTSFCRSSAPMLECCGPCCCCPSIASIPLPCCPPQTYCNPPSCPSACRKGYTPNPAIKLPPHCLCPARCAPVPCCQKQCVVISRCACSPKPVVAEGCFDGKKIQGPMRLPYVAPPCPIESSCAAQDPPAYGL